MIRVQSAACSITAFSFSSDIFDTAYKKAVVVFQDMNSFGQFIMKDAMLERFFSEYFFVKNNGLIPAQLSFIRGKCFSSDIFDTAYKKSLITASILTPLLTISIILVFARL